MRLTFVRNQLCLQANWNWSARNGNVTYSLGPRGGIWCNLGDNVDSDNRDIYIHGTNHEARLGQFQSSVCVLMHNLEIIDLFDQVCVGDQVWISL